MKNDNSALKIGFWSRIDYGSPGYRLGLPKLGAEVFSKWDSVDFVVIAGGLIYHKYKDQLKEEMRGIRGSDRAEAKKEFIKTAAEDLAKTLPRIRSSKPDEQWVKIFIVTSPAYDGDLGYQIVHRLTKLRKADIVHWAHGYGIFPTRKEGRDIAVLTPMKATWLRGKYDSTPVERVILDWKGQHYDKEPAFLVIGCFGTHVQKPGGGESKLPFISVPELCRPWDTKTGSENQVGAVVLEYKTDGTAVVRNYNFNDLLTNETVAIKPPAGASNLQQKIVEIMKKNHSQTIGLLAHHLDIGRNRVELYKNLDELRVDESSQKFVATQKFRTTKSWPGVVYDDSSKRYYFNPEWFKTELRFCLPNGGKRKVDSIVAFGCLHAGCVHTNRDYFKNKVPDLIVERGADILIGAGDFIEGTKHDLILRGEVFGGMNNSAQERSAAMLVGNVILKVFKKRMAQILGSRLNSRKRKRINAKTLKNAIEKSLVTFIYIYGNHCAWSLDSGYDPLGIFRPWVIDHVVKGARKFLTYYKLNASYIERDLISKRIIELNERNYYKLQSGLELSIRHLWLSRTLTISIRLQQVLEASESQVVVSANFHVAAGLGRWDNEIGQRYCLQVGTIKDYSQYEGQKTKRLDTGVGCLKVVSVNGRVLMTEVIFDKANHRPSLDNKTIEQLYCGSENEDSF